MAGSYPDPISYRMAYDVDGCVGFSYPESTGVITPISGANLAEMNDEDSTQVNFGISNATGNFGIIFPENRDLAGYMCAYLNGISTAGAISTSPDTTNGLDGTWTVRANPWVMTTSASPSYRTAQQALSVTGIKAVRFRFFSDSGVFIFGVAQMHLYGQPSSSTPDRLVMWDPTASSLLAANALDWGNTPRSSSADRTFRIKNVSTTQTAQGIIISGEANTDFTPSVPGQYLYSSNGTTFTATLNIGDLAPTAVSSVLTIRRVTPSNAALGVHAFRVKAAATTWV